MTGLLEWVKGTWGDVTGSTYEVYESRSRDSLDVKTIRPYGRTMTTKGLIRLNKDNEIVWGSGPSFVLEPFGSSLLSPVQLKWKPVGRSSKWFVLTRRDISRDVGSRVPSRQEESAAEVEKAGLAKEGWRGGWPEENRVWSSWSEGAWPGRSGEEVKPEEKTSWSSMSEEVWLGKSGEDGWANKPEEKPWPSWSEESGKEGWSDRPEEKTSWSSWSDDAWPSKSGEEACAPRRHSWVNYLDPDGHSLERGAESRHAYMKEDRVKEYSNQFPTPAPVSPQKSPSKDTPHRARPEQTVDAAGRRGWEPHDTPSLTPRRHPTGAREARARSRGPVAREARKSEQTVPKVQRSCADLIGRHLNQPAKARGPAAASRAAAQPPEANKSRSRRASGPKARAASEMPRQRRATVHTVPEMPRQHRAPSTENVEAEAANSEPPILDSGETSPKISPAKPPVNIDQFSGPILEPPCSDSWDWPLSRFEKKDRVFMLDDCLMFMDSRLAQEEIARLKAQVQVLQASVTYQ